MPTYEYRCKDCGTEFEKTLRFSEATQLPACPRCKCKGALWELLPENGLPESNLSGSIQPTIPLSFLHLMKE